MIADPWPSIRTRTSMNMLPTRLPHPQASRMRKSLVIACALVVLLTLPLTVLAIQAAVEGTSHRFGLFLSEPVTATPTTAATYRASMATPALVTTPVPAPLVDIADVQKQLPFRIHVPATLPPNVVLLSATLIPGHTAHSAPQGIHLVYRSVKDSEDTLTVEQVTNQGKIEEKVPASRVEQVVVHGFPAIYVKGTWRSFGAADKGDDAQRDTSIDRSILSWEENGITYKLISYKLGLTREEMIKIAENLQ